MALAPIDLQMLFAQVDKVGKEVFQEKEGAMLRASMHSDHLQELENERLKTVREASENGEGLERLKEKKDGRSQTFFEEPEAEHENEDSENKSQQKNADSSKSRHLKDPKLGNYVDISG